MLRTAVVGCGGIGFNHLRALAALPEIEIVAVVDPAAELAATRAKEFEARALSRVDKLPADLDFVTVATPPATHYTLARELLDAGYHVFCEKPLTLTVASGRTLVDLAAARRRHLGVGFKMRYEPWFQKAKELIDDIGPLRQVILTKQQPKHDKPWLAETGAMQELSSHDFDLIAWICGSEPAEMLSARLDHRFGWPAEDGYSLQVRYANGMVGALNGLYCETMKFTGRDQTLRFHGERGYLHIDRGERVVLHTDGVEEFTFDERPNGFERELADFAAAVRGEAAEYPDGAAGVRATWIVEQARLAAGEPAPVQPGHEPQEAR